MFDPTIGTSAKMQTLARYTAFQLRKTLEFPDGDFYIEKLVSQLYGKIKYFSNIRFRRNCKRHRQRN